jgi:hypothetical protein
MKYTKMLKLSLIFLSLANAVTKRREKFILFNRVAIIILLYSSIVGYDSLAIISLGRGISIYGGLFHYVHSFDILMYLFNIIELIGFNAITISLYSPLAFLESYKLTNTQMPLVQIGVQGNESDQIVNKIDP